MENKAPQQLKEWLRREGRKSLWIAEQTGADRATVSQWITGRRVPLPPARKLLANITGLDIASKEAWE